MKIRKNADQKNFVVAKEYYDLGTLLDLVKTGECFIFADNYTYKTITFISEIKEDDIFRVFASNCTDIKVIYSKEYGEYESVVITKSGKTIKVML